MSSASGAALGAVRRNLISPSPVALPARFLKKSAAVSTTPTFSATATAIHWFKNTPSSFAGRWAAFWMDSGSFNGYVDLLNYLGLTFFNSSAGGNTGILNRSAANSTVDGQPLKGRLILELSASLKRCPDTKPHFFLPSILPPPETGLSSVSTSGGDATSAACCWNGFACS